MGSTEDDLWTAAPAEDDASPDAEDFDGVMAGQLEMEDDVEKLLAYGERFPEQWGGLWMDGVRVVVSFIDPDRHHDDIVKLVEHPDRVEIVQAPWTAAELDRVRELVEASLEAQPDAWSSVGNSAQHIHVRLHASGLDLAERLWAEHGQILKITVAGHDYPLDLEAVSAEERWPGPEQSQPWPDGLEVDWEFESPTLRQGDYLRGRLLLRATTAPVSLDTDQPLYGELLDSEGLVANDPSGFRTGTGRLVRLMRGEVTSIDFGASTDSARLADGAYVPAGRWQLVVPIPVHGPQDDDKPRSTQLVAGPVPIELLTR